MGFDSSTHSFEVSRPVATGLETVLPLVRGLGYSTIRDDLTIGVGIPGRIDNDYPSAMPNNIVGRPQFKCYEKIRVPIAQLIDDGSFTVSPDFHRLASTFRRPERGRLSKLTRSILEIPEKLQSIAEKYGETDPNSVTIVSQGLVFRPARLKQGTELALRISNPERLMEEAEVYYSIFGRIKALKPFVNASRGNELDIPLASISVGADQDEIKMLSAKYGYYLDKTIKVKLGKTLPPFVH